MSAILIFSPSSQKVSPSTTQVRRVIPQSSKRGEEVSATSENFGVSSDEVNEVEPNVGQFSASIPPANTIENAPSPKIHSLRRCFPRCFFSSSRKSKRMTLSSSERSEEHTSELQ